MGWSLTIEEKPSPYNYGLNNPIIMTDTDGRAASPIYDPNGNLLGTDDLGVQGKAIVMEKDKFKYDDALENNLGTGGLQPIFLLICLIKRKSLFKQR